MAAVCKMEETFPMRLALGVNDIPVLQPLSSKQHHTLRSSTTSIIFCQKQSYLYYLEGQSVTLQSVLFKMDFYLRWTES